MNDILKTYMERFRENRHTLRRYTAFVLALAIITTLFVNWQLHGVGISMTAQYQCGEEEHTHTADCYTKVLTCGYEEGELENADELAAAAATSQPTVEAEPAPLALEPQIEFVPHEHTDDCYTEVQTLTCMEEEHVHGDDCFDPEDGSLICEKFEHTHDENCYTTEYELTCGLEEGELVEQVVEPTQSAELAAMAVAEPVALEPTVDTVEPIYHHHTDACYEEVLTCPLPEHHHTVACLSDTSADLETPEEWQAANAEAVMTGNWAEDLVSVAKTQLGYEQSEKNFEIDPADGVTLRYYSRYGQSYGNPYGEWDVMFLSYCLKYAGIPQSAIPQEASVLALRSSMSDMDWLLDGEDGSAADVGDIVIYNKYVTRTVAVDSSADSAEPDLDDQFSVDTEFENSAELEDSGVSALDAAPSADDSTGAQDTAATSGTQDTVLTPEPVDPQTEQPAEKPVDSADTAAPSVVSPAAEPQTTTVTDALPVETVGIVSSVDKDADTLTVISGDVDGKVAEVTLFNTEVVGVVDVAAAQYADTYGGQLPSRPNRAPTLMTTEEPTYLDYFVETPEGETTSTGMKKGGITKYTFKIDNTEQTDNFTVKADQSVYFTFDYQIAGGVLEKVDGKNVLTYKLPAELCPKAETDTEIYDRAGHKVGTQYFHKNGTTTLVFDPNSSYFNPAETFSGQFSYDWTYSKESATENKTFHFPGSSTEITLEKYQDIKIEKSQPLNDDGTIQETSDGKTKIRYTVTVSSEHGWDEKVQIWDGLKRVNGDIQAEYDKDSFELKKYKADGTFETVTCTPDFTKNTDSKYSGYENTFQIERLDELKAGERYELTYDVLTTRTGYSELQNTATTDNGNKQADRKVTLDSLITKEQGTYDSANNCIDWIVTVKNPTGSDLNGYTVTDTLDNGATIIGNVKRYVQQKNNGQWLETSDTAQTPVLITPTASGFTYTFPAGSDAKLYQFKYQTTLPAGVTSVKNKAEYSKELNGNKFTDEKTFNTSGGGQGGQTFSPHKTASGNLAPKDADHPNLLAAPWTITAAIPGKGTYEIKDNIGGYWFNGKNIHYGIASELQKQIEQSFDLTYTSGGQESTLNYNALTQRSDITFKVTYYSNEWWQNPVSSTDDTTQVRSFKIELDTTKCTLALSQLTLKYSTQVDISDLSEGDRITISNKLDNENSVSYDYQKPSTGLKMSKGVKMVNKSDSVNNIFWYCGAPDQSSGGTLTPNYSDFQNKVLQYQILLDFSSVSDTLPATITLTDTLPKGLTYRTTNTPSATIVFIKGYGNGVWSEKLPLKGSGERSIRDYFADPSKLDINTPAEGSEDGQTITFHIDGLDKLDFAELKKQGYTELVLCYQAELTDPRWSNVKFDEFLYTNKIKWKEENKQDKVDVKVTQKVDVLKKEALQITDKNYSRVKYTLTINPAAKDLDPASTTVTLTDILTVQHASVQASLDIFSVKLYNADTNQEISKYEYSYTQPVLGKDGNGYPTYTTTFTLPDSTPLVLEYEYVTNATANINLSNEAKISGGSASVKDFELIKVGASSTVHQAKLTVYKVDKRNYSNALTGATFALDRFDSSTGGWVSVQNEAKVDANGTLTFYFASTDGLQENTLYRLTETKAPAGYSKASAPYYFIYQASGYDEAAAYNDAVGGCSGEGIPVQNAANLLYCANGKASELFVPNTANSLTIIKHWRDKDNNTLTAAQAKLDEVEVYLYCYKTSEGKDTATLYPHQNTVTLEKSKDWTATVPIADEYLNDYTFYIKEKDGNSSRFTVVYDQPEGVTVGNTLTFTNTETDNADYELPSTGGSGTLPYTAVGGTMMLSALAYSFIHRKRRREGRADD